MVLDHHLPVDKWLSTIDFPIIVLQHTSDPYGSFQEVKQYFNNTGRNNIAVIELPGDTHDYLELDVIKEYTAKLLG